MLVRNSLEIMGNQSNSESYITSALVGIYGGLLNYYMDKQPSQGVIYSEFLIDVRQLCNTAKFN